MSEQKAVQQNCAVKHKKVRWRNSSGRPFETVSRIELDSLWNVMKTMFVKKKKENLFSLLNMQTIIITHLSRWKPLLNAKNLTTSLRNYNKPLSHPNIINLYIINKFEISLFLDQYQSGMHWVIIIGWIWRHSLKVSRHKKLVHKLNKFIF